MPVLQRKLARELTENHRDYTGLHTGQERVFNAPDKKVRAPRLELHDVHTICDRDPVKGRIWFTGNPWPKGHAIEKATWSGRLDPGGALFFDLHLESASYYAGDRPRTEEDDDEPGDWKARGVWANYHRCSLSSTKWGHRGVRVGSPETPFDWTKLDGKTLRVDRAKEVLPTFADGELAAFHIYLLGHDAVADHAIRFTRSRATWSIDWKAKIALAYTGHRNLAHRLRAELRGLGFSGFEIPTGMTAKAARALFAAAVTDPAKWTIARRRFVRA